MYSQAFAQHALIYVPPEVGRAGSSTGSWRSLSEAVVVWDGPPSMRTRFSLQSVYGDLREFFCEQVRIPDCPDDVLLQELRHVSDTIGNKRLEEADHVRVYQVLRDIDSELAKNTTLVDLMARAASTPEFQRLRFIPFRTVRGELRLGRLVDTLYIPDQRGDFANMFKDAVSMVTLPPEDPDGSLAALRRLLNTVWRTSSLKMLDNSTVRCEIEGGRNHQWHVDNEGTRRYNSSVRFIER